MKAFLISDNVDTLVGMKISGIRGIVLHDKLEVINKLQEVKEDKEIGIIIITEKLAKLVPEEVNKMKLSKEGTLIIEIPDRHGTIRGESPITGYVKESIGLKI